MFSDPTGHTETPCSERPCTGGGGKSGDGEGSSGKGGEIPPITKASDPYEWLRKLEESELEYKPHSILKHSPESSGTELFNKSLKSTSPQTRFTSSEEMVDSIMNTIEQKLVDINKFAEGASKGVTKPFSIGEEAGFSGFNNGMPISGRGVVKVVIQFDGEGGWALYTAYPVP